MRRGAAPAMVLGGVAMVALFIPFTISHGPTSINLEREVAGWDMHRWGALLGSVPFALLAWGVWGCREEVAGPRRAARVALAACCLVMLGFLAMNLAFRALGPPFDLFLLAPASAVLAATAAVPALRRALLVLLALAYAAALVVGLVPQPAFDDHDLYRVFGLVAYVGVPLLWAALGVDLLRRRPAPAL